MDLACNPRVAAMEAYTPGEQPQGTGWIKLNTNEFPYPPAPAVLEALGQLVSDPIRGREAARKYPDPHCNGLRDSLVTHLDAGLDRDNILMGNGSDEILRLLFHGFLDSGSSTTGCDTVAVLNPTYSLYDTLAAMFGGKIESHTALEDQGQTLPESLLGSAATIAIVANPNPPLGTLYSLDEIRRLLDARPGRLTIIDEAYVDFAGGQTAISLLPEYPNLAVTRTFSKGMALAGLRVGYVVAARAITGHLDRIRDSYNINALTQVAAKAAVESYPYYRDCSDRIVQTRSRTAQALRDLGFLVPPAHGNFLFARHPRALELMAHLRDQKILVRHFSKPALSNGIRITVGTEEEMDRLMAVLRDGLANLR